MSARSFRSVGWVAAVAATALGCYMVNLKVAAERAALEEVETRIVLAQRDIRLLQTEIGTRGRLAQLEKWNVKVLALSAPAANQFVEGSFQLATLVAPKKTIDPAAPVVLASAPAPERRPVLNDDAAVATPAAGTPVTELMHTASLKRDLSEARSQPKAKLPAEPTDEAAVTKKKSVEKPASPRGQGADKAAKAAKAAGAESVAAKSSKARVAEPNAAKTTSTKSTSTKTAAAKPVSTKPKSREAKTDQ